MAENFFKEQFGNITKIKVCTTTADLNFDTYTEPGTYEIYEDMGNEQSRIYLLTVDKSVTGACVKQTRIYCGTVETRQTTTAGAWTAWEALSGGGSVDLSDYSTTLETEEMIVNQLSVAIPPLENDIGALDERVGNIEADYVKNTDYADNSAKYGLVKVAYGYGTQISSDGYLAIARCSKSEIDAKTNSTHPITPDVLEYAVKSVGDGYYATEAQMGEIETALDSILAIQETIVGGVN